MTRPAPRCEHCEAAGRPHKVIDLGQRSTAMHPNPYWDEDGRYHVHDRNHVTRTFQCRRCYYTWHETTYTQPCPSPTCDFGKEETDGSDSDNP